MITSEFEDKIYTSRIVFRGSCPLYPLTPLETYHNTWTLSPHLSYLSKYNSVQLSTFTTCPINSFLSVSPDITSSDSPFIHCFANPTDASIISSNLAIIDITNPLPEPQLTPCPATFAGWLGVSFLDEDNITHNRSSRISEILHLYSLPTSVIHSFSSLPVSLQRLSVFIFSRFTQ